MPKAFAFIGHAGVRSAVVRSLEENGWSYVAEEAQADVIFTYFSNMSALEDAYFDTEGLIRQAEKNTLLVDLSPATPSFARELSAVAVVNDLRFVEAPLVVVNPARFDAFASENMRCVVACDDVDAAQEAMGVIECFTESVDRVEANGMAQLAKAACTSQVISQILGTIESYALFASAGTVDANALPLCAPVAQCLVESIANDDFEGDCTVELLMGDVAAAMTVAEESELVLPQLEAALHLLEVLAIIGGADMSAGALSLLYREEQASAEHGLDWTRAEGLFDDAHECGCDCGCDHDHGHGHEGYDEYGYGDDDSFGYAGGFAGGYSSN